MDKRWEIKPKDLEDEKIIEACKRLTQEINKTIGTHKHTYDTISICKKIEKAYANYNEPRNICQKVEYCLKSFAHGISEKEKWVLKAQPHQQTLVVIWFLKINIFTILYFI